MQNSMSLQNNQFIIHAFHKSMKSHFDVILKHIYVFVTRLEKKSDGIDFPSEMFQLISANDNIN